MKWIIAAVMVLFCAGCAGSGYDWDREQEMRGDKRQDCTGTKSTNEAANITNCPQIRPDGE